MQVPNRLAVIDSKIPNNELGLAICRLCGALATDGTIYRHDKVWNGYYRSSYYFELTDEYKENVEIIANLVKQILGKEGSIKPNKGSFRFRIGSKKLVEYFNSIGFPLGDKTSKIFIPNSIFLLDRKFKLAFISGALMFDGSVKLDGTLEFSTISKKFRDQIINILKNENIHIYKFQRRCTKWSSTMKYGFSSRSFAFFREILEGPKSKRLELIKYGMKLSFEDLLKLFPERKHSKIPFLREIYFELKKEFPKSLEFKGIKNRIEKKYNIKIHRNALSIYLNILVKSNLIKRIKRRYQFAAKFNSS
jgi:hypothetical protein